MHARCLLQQRQAAGSIRGAGGSLRQHLLVALCRCLQRCALREGRGAVCGRSSSGSGEGGSEALNLPAVLLAKAHKGLLEVLQGGLRLRQGLGMGLGEVRMLLRQGCSCGSSRVSSAGRKLIRVLLPVGCSCSLKRLHFLRSKCAVLIALLGSGCSSRLCLLHGSSSSSSSGCQCLCMLLGSGCSLCLALLRGCSNSSCQRLCVLSLGLARCCRHSSCNGLCVLPGCSLKLLRGSRSCSSERLRLALLHSCSDCCCNLHLTHLRGCSSCCCKCLCMLLGSSTCIRLRLLHGCSHCLCHCLC